MPPEAPREALLHRHLVEQLPGVVFRMTHERPVSRVTYISPQVIELFGHPPERWLDDPGFWIGIVVLEDVDRVVAAWERSLSTGTPYVDEYRIRHADGRTVWVRETTHPVVDASGAIVAWQGLTVDVSGAKAVEASRESSEARYRALVEQLPAVVYVDSDDDPPRSIYVSPRSAQVLGYPPAAYVADPNLWSRTIHPQDRDRVTAAWQRAVRTGEPFLQDYRFVRPDGATVWVRDSSIRIEDRERGVRTWQGVILDVTARVVAEREAEEQTARYQALVEGVPAVVYEMGPDDERRTIYVSPQIEALLGYTRREWLDQPDIWVELLHPDDREHILEAHDRHNETGEAWRREYRLIAADGRTVWVRDQAVLLRDADGRPLTWQGLLLDATAEKEAEERRRAAHEELEFRVRARTSQLADANELMSLEIGERRRVERELLATKERYRHLVEDLPAVIYIWQTRERQDGVDESYVSPQVEDLLGFTPAEWHADWTVWERRLHPHDRDRIVAATEHTARTGEPFQEEFRYLAKDGRVVWILDRATLLERDEQGRPLILQGVMMDITARKLAERKAAEAEERFREIAEWSPVSPWAFELSVDGSAEAIRVDYVGPAIGQTLGYPVARWIDDTERWYEMVHPDDRDELRRAMRHHLATGEPWTLDFRMIAADGRLVWVRDRGRCAARDERGQPTRFVGALADITQERQRLDGIVAATRSTHAVAEGMPAVAWTEVVDAATGRRRYTYIGPQARELFGYEAAELIAEPRHFERMLHPEDRDRVLATWDVHDETGEPWADEFRVRRRDGRVRWFHSVARRATEPDAPAAVWHGVSIDVTDARERSRSHEDARDVGTPDDGREAARP